jgi:hypothetical protein
MKKHKVKGLSLLAFLLAVGVAGLIKPAFMARRVSAKPAFMDRYDRNAYSKIELRGRCTVCHVGHGGEERNAFGEAFGDAGYRITPKLRKEFPEMFERENADATKEER